MKRLIFLLALVFSIPSFAVNADDDVGKQIVNVDHADQPMVAILDVNDIHVDVVDLPEGTMVQNHSVIAPETVKSYVETEQFPTDVGWYMSPELSSDQPPNQKRIRGSAGGNPGR